MDNSQLSDIQVKDLTAISPQEVVVSPPETTLDTTSGETRIRATGTNKQLADGVYVKTYGVFAKDDTGNEVLYGVTVSPNPNYFPAYDGVTPQAVTYSYKTVIQETSNITMTNSNDVYVTQEDLTEAIGKIPQPDLSNYATQQQLAIKADDSKVVHTADMRKPANQVAGMDDVNAKQDKLTYTAANDATSFHRDATGTVSESGNFPGLQVKGVTVATSDDLKSIKDSAWRLMALPDQQASKNLSLLYQVDKVNKQLKINLSGTFGSITSDWAAGIVIADFGNIINGITSVDAYLTLIKLATDDSNAHFNAWNQGGTQNLTTNPTVNFTGSKLLIRCSDRAINSGYGRISVPTGEDFAMVNNTIQYDELV
mgnify:FL=1